MTTPCWPWQNLLHAGPENLFSGLTALTAEFTVGEGELMTHDEPRSGGSTIWNLVPVISNRRCDRTFPNSVSTFTVIYN
jgi:hypothetical protein